MTFPMPKIGWGEVRLLTTQAWENACWVLSGTKRAEDPVRWDSALISAIAEFDAWVNYARQEYPEYNGDFMLDYEQHWGACVPFENGDRWVFDIPANSWMIVKPDGKLIITRNLKEK